ncbi:uncharacterized protein BDR25DRAFT_308509 [Lindgomyces ingoldianus]|uniref:Uncharacterized protein n=1 Tax=Lindgomyces ingoldianus TaxID=673940 RepID=A0ACB6REP7_9PLEO|nr:uncharacterized protein BDR25DRAFT_308509 [Lindgomyces ingoldianus]KAF2477611.1 hypothetical protein BDR25DRAFT_308509 [Lindgomyces ingoldianus]
MSLFSKVRKAKEAAKNHHNSTHEQTAEYQPPPALCKHIPTHAAQDTQAAGLAMWTPGEKRARIAAARKRRSEVTVSLNHCHSPSDVGILARNRSCIHKATEDDISIESVMYKPQPQSYQPKAPRDTYQPESREEYHAFSNPRDVPVQPPRRNWPSYHRHVRSSSFMTRRKSHFSHVATEKSELPGVRAMLSKFMLQVEPENTFPQSSQNSTCSAVSPKTSSIESAPPTETSPKRSSSSQRARMLSKPKPPGYKQQPIVEISMPYSSDDEHSIASSTIPAWRYEDFTRETESPTIVESISHSNSIASRKGSFSRSLFHRRKISVMSH